MTDRPVTPTDLAALMDRATPSQIVEALRLAADNRYEAVEERLRFLADVDYVGLEEAQQIAAARRHASLGTDGLTPVRGGVDHAACPPDVHDREPGTDYVRPYADKLDQHGMLSDRQSVDAEGLLACNDCGRPMFYCTNDEQYHHVDRDAECFLIGAW